MIHWISCLPPFGYIAYAFLVIHSKIGLCISVNPYYAFIQHSMEIYSQKIFRSYLEKQPEYFPPVPPPKTCLPEMSILVPTLEGVEIHDHENELAVTVEGSNLWFCYQLSVGGHSVELPSCNFSGTSIQFNILKSGSKMTLRNGRVKVILHNHFSRPRKSEMLAIQKVCNCLV